MTALERAEQIVHLYGGYDADIRDAIHRAIVEHSNAELERRRKDAQRHRDFIAGCQQLLGTHDRLDVAINAELERRRAMEARMRQAVGVVRTILANAVPSGLDWGNSEIARLAKQAMEVLEDFDA